MGPFHWTVWVSITAIYLMGILPLVFSETQTLRNLLTNPEQLEEMFWYVFGNFTNCFTFAGRRSWNKADKITTKILVGESYEKLDILDYIGILYRFLLGVYYNCDGLLHRIDYCFRNFT